MRIVTPHSAYCSRDDLHAGGLRSSKPRHVAILIAVAAIVLVPGPTTVAEAQTTANKSSTIVLRPGETDFRHGPHIELAAVPDENLCHVSYPCWDYKIRVLDSSDDMRLRVSLSVGFESIDHMREHPPERPQFRLVLMDPKFSDDPVTASEHKKSVDVWWYHDEMWWDRYTMSVPAAGTWTLRVVPLSARDVNFRIRAALQEIPAQSKTTRLLLPDLRSIPPFELGFMVPTRTFGPGVSSPSAAPGCMAEELEEHLLVGSPATDPPLACLRMSLGFENAGVGPFLMTAACNIYEPCPESGIEDLDSADLYQRYYETDATEDAVPPYWWKLSETQAEEPSGKGVWHRHHGHMHYANLYGVTLFEVKEMDRRPYLEQLGQGHKLGFGPGEEWMADWQFPGQQPKNCCYPPVPSEDYWLGMSPGWGDVYEWNRSGNYVRFPTTGIGGDRQLGTPRPGIYLARGEVDPNREIVESDETNNVSYVLFEVEWTDPVEGLTTRPVQVRVLERGYGSDPWDPAKSVVTTAP